MNVRYKLLPCSIWNIGVIETWLSKMASKGLFIENFGRYFTKFNKGEPSNTHYRIDMIPTKNDDELESKINKYKNCGWKYVNTYMNFHIFSSPHEFNSNEVYNITEEQAALLKPQYKKKIKDILICFLIFFILILLPSFFTKIDLYTYLLELNVLDVLAFFLLSISFFYELYEAFLIKRLIKHLEQGIPIVHSCDWNLRSYLSIFYKAIFFVIISILFLLPYKQFFYEKYKYIEDSLEEFPIVTLQDICTIKYESTGTELKFRPETWARSESTLLMPVKFDASQSSRVFIEPNEWKTIYLKSTSHKLRLESMVDDYLLELIDQQNKITELTPISVDTNQYNNFDILKMYKSQDTYFIYASRDEGIITLSYLYDDDIDTVLKAIDEKLTLLINYVSKS